MHSYVAAKKHTFLCFTSATTIDANSANSRTRKQRTRQDLGRTSRLSVRKKEHCWCQRYVRQPLQRVCELFVPFARSSLVRSSEALTFRKFLWNAGLRFLLQIGNTKVRVKKFFKYRRTCVLDEVRFSMACPVKDESNSAKQSIYSQCYLMCYEKHFESPQGFETRNRTIPTYSRFVSPACSNANQ